MSSSSNRLTSPVVVSGASSRLAKPTNSHRHHKHAKMAAVAASAATASSGSSRQQQRVNEPATAASDELVLTMNPFLNDFIDCIENLPNRLQLLLSELRSVDVLSNGECWLAARQWAELNLSIALLLLLQPFTERYSALNRSSRSR